MEETQGLLGRLAVHKGWLQHQQLVEAVAEQGRFGNEEKKLGQVLVELGFLSEAQVVELLRLQKAFVAQSRRQRDAEAQQTASRVQAAKAASSWMPGQDPFAAAKVVRESAADAPPPGSFDDEPPWLASHPEVIPTGAPFEPAPFLQAPEDPAVGFEEPQKTAVHLRPDSVVLEPEVLEVVPKLRDAPLRSPRLDEILSDAARRGASDVHLHPGAPFSLRLHGSLISEGPVATDQTIRPVLDDALTSLQRQILEAEGQLDLAYEVPGIGRFRGNIYDGHTGRNAVFRFIPGFIPTLQQLGLPNDLSRIVGFHQGMVLVTGPAGCGKSTTLAALVDLINEERQDHILTVEDPVEYLHTSKRCLVNQREVHRHTTSFSRALRAALREDPDVLVIGELRDLETISLAMTAAETGHLVLATLHTAGAITTINRLIGTFPPDEQGQIRTMLSESLRAVISQRLVPRADGTGRVPALEILKIDRAVANVIRENRTFQLRSTLQTGQKKGMLLLDNHLALLVQQGIISREAALKEARDARVIPGG